jgi:GT2 family glycosyltransferase
MKYILFIGFWAFCGTTSYAQVYKFRAFQTAILEHNSNEPLKWNETDILIVMNFDKNKIMIYTNHTQDLDLIKNTKNWTDEKDNIWASYDAVDEDGGQIIVKMEVFSDQNGRHNSTLFLLYKDGEVVYRLKKAGE